MATRRDFLKSSMMASTAILTASRLLTDGGLGNVEAAPLQPATETVAIRLRVNGQNYGLRLRPAHLATRSAARETGSSRNKEGLQSRSMRRLYDPC